ncbi:MAG: tetratricopeptide repeat protein [Gemmataceae bacterium]|nr:tetratricopeptide repeat protein [Gemmataceae bacterium]
MRRRLNVRLLVWTVGAIAVSAAGTHLLHGFQVRRNADALLRQAERSVTDGQLFKAATYYRHYLAYEPDDTAALAEYARTLDRLARSRAARLRAVLVMEQTLRRNPALHDLRERLVQLTTTLGKFGDAIRHLEVLTVAFPKRGDLEHHLGWCQEARRDYQAAADAFARAVKKAPAQLDSHVLLAELLRRLDRPEEATQALDAMVAANPQSHRALLLRGRDHRRRGALDAAAADVRRAAELAPDDAAVLLAAADVEQARGRLDEARSTLRRGLKLHPRDDRFHHTLASVELEAGRRGDALACLRGGLEALPEADTLAARLADLLLDDGDQDEVAELAARVRKSGSWAIADYLDGRALAQRGRWAEASDVLEKARGGLGTILPWAARAEVWQGRCHEQAGETELRLAAYRRATALDPALPAARLGRAAALLDAGAIGEAVIEARRLTVAKAASAEAWALLGRALVRRNLAEAVGRRDWKEVNDVLARAEEALPGATAVALARAEVLEAQGNRDGARTILETARTARPQDARLWAALADLAGRGGQPKEAAKLLERARGEVGDAVELRLVRVRRALALGGAAARKALDRLAQEPRAALDAAAQARLLRGLAEAFQQTGAAAEAKKAWRDLAALRPKDLGSRMRLFDLALQAGDDAACAAIVADLRRLEGEGGVLWRAGEVGRAVARAGRGDRSGLPEARQRLGEIKQRQPDWSRASLLEAALDELQGDFAGALKHYHQAVERGERQAAVLVRLAQLFYQRGRTLEAGRMLRLLEEQGPLGRAAARLGAEVALRDRDPARALTLARQAVAADSRDYRDRLWLARIQAAAGKDDDAETTLRAAVAAAGRVPDTWVALVRHLARTGQKAEAGAALAEAARRLPPDRATLALARAHEAVGELDQAGELYRQALQARPRDFVALRAAADFHLRQDEFRKAEPYLRRLCAAATGTPPQDGQAARRLLAIGLATTAAGGAEALTLLDENARQRSKNSADDVARAYVRAVQPAQRSEARRLLEGIENHHALPPEDQFLVVRAWEAVGDDGRARNLMLGLLGAVGDDPRYLTHHIGTLIRAGDLEDAALYLGRLERVAAGTARTRTLRQALRQARAEKGL